jgi:hypothetical protein
MPDGRQCGTCRWWSFDAELSRNAGEPCGRCEWPAPRRFPDSMTGDIGHAANGQGEAPYGGTIVARLMLARHVMAEEWGRTCPTWSAKDFG